jgi:nuclear receptor-binding protein
MSQENLNLNQYNSQQPIQQQQQQQVVTGVNGNAGHGQSTSFVSNHQNDNININNKQNVTSQHSSTNQQSIESPIIVNTTGSTSTNTQHSSAQIISNNNTTTTNTNIERSNTLTTSVDPFTESNTTTESGDETEEENEEVEHSPGGRWSKRNQSVTQRDVPGIDKAYLAMDTENGYEVVWNEINISGGKKFKNTNNISNDEKKIDAIFSQLIKLNHPNIVKFHHYWIDKDEKELKRIIFITEYMSSGSLKQFLRKAKKTNQSIKKQTWKRWTIQLLVALHYLHNSEEPIIHDDLSCDTIYIQHNGLIKIGSIAPDIVNNHVKTCVDISKFLKNMHYMAPETREIGFITANEEITDLNSLITKETQQTSNEAASSLSVATIKFEKNNKTTAVDIYAFGIVALEMFNLEFGGNGDTHPVTPELIKQSIEMLDEKQQTFINKCLEIDPNKRPTAKQLLFDPLLFEVPSLRLMAAHQYINNQNETRETNTEINSLTRLPDCVIATSKHQDFTYSKLGSFFDANKYLEDVRNGIYPLTAFGLDRQIKKTLATLLPLNTSLNNHNGNSSNNLRTTYNSGSSSSGARQQSEEPPKMSSYGASVSPSEDASNTTTMATPTATTTPTTELAQDLQISDTLSNASGNTSLNYLSSTSSSPSSTSPSQSLSLQQAQQAHQFQQNQFDSMAATMSMMQTGGEPLSNSPTPSSMSQSHSGTQSPVNNVPSNLSNGALLSSLINNNNLNYSSLVGDVNQNLLIGNENVMLTTTTTITTTNNNNNLPSNNANSLEKRHAHIMNSNLTLTDLNNFTLTLKITFDDKSARLITSSINRNDTVNKLADELISFGLVNELDKKNLYETLTESWVKYESIVAEQQQLQQQQQQSHDNTYTNQSNSAAALL